jgi:glycine oxidase
MSSSKATSKKLSARTTRAKSRKQSATETHVVIVGGGIMGTSSALALARRGVRVTVLEKSVPGAEASSAAAGILGAQAESSEPGPTYELFHASSRLYPLWVRELETTTGLNVEYRTAGTLEVGFQASAVTALHRKFRWQSAPVDKLSGAQLRAAEPSLSAKLAGGVLLGSDGRVTPPLLYRATHIAAARAGVTFKTGAHVRQVVVDGGRVTGVALDDGSLLEADAVVIAAGSWTNLVGGLDLAKNEVIPARGQIVELESPEPLLSRVVFGPRCYLLPRDDGRTLVGSTLEFVGFKKDVTAEAVRNLLDAAIELVPALAQATMNRAWSNFRPYTKDTLPLLGRGHAEGLFVASGHYRNGILLAPITAEIVTRLVLGERPPLDIAPFNPLRTATARD